MGYREDMAAIIAEREQRNYLRALMEQQDQAPAQNYAAIEEGGQLPQPSNFLVAGQGPPSAPSAPAPAAAPPSNYLADMAAKSQQYESESPPAMMPLRTDPARDTPTRYKDPFYNPETDRASAMPMNAMRNSETGEMISMNFGGGGGFDLGSLNPAWGQQQQRIKVVGFGNDGITSDLGETMGPAPQLDMTRPAVDTARGRGYYGKDGAVYVKGPDGYTKILQGYDAAASMAHNAADVKRRTGEAGIAHSEEQIAASQLARSIKDDPGSQAMLTKRFGQPEKDMRWRADGTLEPIPGGQKNQDATDVIGILNQAEPLIDKATSSGAGAAMDSLGRLVGWSGESGDAAAKLQTLQGMLVSKMPKMSGPQSDKDVMLYREMAGKIGDPAVPASQKRAAMQTIRTLNERYASPQPSASPQGGATSIPSGAIAHLRANPGLRAQFDAKYGAGAAARAMGG